MTSHAPPVAWSTAAGRVSAVATEKGPVALRCGCLWPAARWSRLFCGNIGVDFPQLKILGSVMRTMRRSTARPNTRWGALNFVFRKRLDGGYTIAQRGFNETPDHTRQFSGCSSISCLLLQRSMAQSTPADRTPFHPEEWVNIPRRWTLGRKPSPFESVRVLDPEPSGPILAQGQANLARSFPVFKNAAIAQSWAGLIDVTRSTPCP